MSHEPTVDFPDVTDGVPCCMAYAVGGPGKCTCWRPIHEPTTQAPPAPTGGVEFMPRGCGDCAYRADSPERTGEPGVHGDADTLADLVDAGQPFWCHDGMRQVVAYHHPSGHVLPIARDRAWDPEVHAATPYRADGRPGAVCAGWAARRGALLASEPRLQPSYTGQDSDLTAAACQAALTSHTTTTEPTPAAERA